MKELMIHVERIVRPVHATRGRKRRMREELLAHLQAAVEEERARGADDAGAIERAKVRLGEPAQLTRQLQQSLPLVQRVLFSKIPSRVMDQWAVRLERQPRSQLRQVELLPPTASVLLLTGGTLLCAGVLRLAVPPAFGHAPAPMLSQISLHYPIGMAVGTFVLASLIPGVVALAWIVTCLNWLASAVIPVTTTGSSTQRWKLARATLALIVVWSVSINALFQRWPTVNELTRSLVLDAALLLVLFLLGRLAAALPRPDETWLTLDVAE